MAKLLGPLHSFAASGSVGKVLTIRPAGATFLASRLRSKPSPESVAMAACRLSASHAASTWRALSVADRQRWTMAADKKQLPAFGYYLQQWVLQAATLDNPAKLPDITP